MKTTNYVNLLIITQLLFSCVPFQPESIVNIKTPDLAFDNTSFDYGALNLGSSATAKFMIMNRGGSTATGCRPVELSDTTNFSFVDDDCTSTSMKAGDHCEVEVASHPASVGAKSLTIVRECASGEKVSTEADQIVVIGVAPAMNWAPMTNDFGGVYVGTSTSPQAFTLSNSGDGSASGCSSPILSDTTNFSITANTCGTADLGVSGNCLVSVAANPTTVGNIETTLSRTCTIGGVVSTTLNQIRVDGQTAILAWDLSTHDFGSVDIGNSSTAQTFTLTNSGTGLAASCSAPSLSNASEFSITSDTCAGADLAAGASCTVEIQGTPSSPGAVYTTLSRVCSQGGATSTTTNGIQMLGNLVSPILSATPNGLSFGSITVGTNSSSSQITFQNTGLAAATTCSAPSLLDAVNFEITADSCMTNDMSPSSSCNVSIRARPTVTGLISTSVSRTCSVGGTVSSGANQITATGILVTDWTQSTMFVPMGSLGIVRSGGGSSPNMKYYFRNTNGLGLTGCTTPSLSNTADFVLVSENCGSGAMAAASLCEVVVKASPVSTGTATTDLTRTCNESGTTSFALTAEGAANSSMAQLALSSDGLCVRMVDGTVRCLSGGYSSMIGDGSSNPNPLAQFVTGVNTAIHISAGNGYACAVLSGGTAQCWGNNSGGRLGTGDSNTAYLPLNVVNVTNATQISAGSYIGCARLSDSSVKCWGNGYLGGGAYSGSPTTAVTASGIANAVSVSSGLSRVCALLADSTIKCWGEKPGNGSWNASSPVVVSTITTAVNVSTGGLEHSCAALADGTVKCWGYNTYGQLGDGTILIRAAPVFVTGISNAVRVMVGYNHSCALLADGTVKCWGQNQYGQLGDGTMINSLTPVTVAGITTATNIDIGAGGNHACVTLADSSIKCWGYNTGNLGDATRSYLVAPGTIPNITTATQVASGDYHTCALLADSTVQCWGRNDDAQVGDTTLLARMNPVAVSGITNATQIQTMAYHTCARLSDSTIKCWGKNDVGQLGDNTTTKRPTPITVIGIANAVKVTTGFGKSCALLSDSTIKCWGTMTGDGTMAQRNSPVLVSGITTAVDVASGGFSCAVLASGVVRCWGDNWYGGLGDGTTTQRPTPVDVSGITNATQVSVGGSHACAILATGQVKCWGYNGSGQLGDSTSGNSYTPVDFLGVVNATSLSLGGNHTCAMMSDQKIKCAGNGALTGSGVTDFYTLTPVYRLALPGTTYAYLGRGNTSQCVIISTGQIQCVGNNENMHSGDNSLAPHTLGGF